MASFRGQCILFGRQAINHQKGKTHAANLVQTARHFVAIANHLIDDALRREIAKIWHQPAFVSKNATTETRWQRSDLRYSRNPRVHPPLCTR